jgi:hypothetical protein
MKAFAIKKINMDKCAKENQNRVNKFNTQLNSIDGDEFSYVEIGNPLKSNCIYEIKNINLKLRNNNKLRLSIGEGILKRNIAKELETNIIWEQAEDSSMEILSSSMNKGEFISILDNYSIILLPGGSVFLKTMKPIDEMMLDMEWIEELL